MTRFRIALPSAQAILRLLRSDKFFLGVLALFLFQAIWIALSGAYSMAFDEYYHFGIIKIYSHQWLPLLGPQSETFAPFGAVARDPSYLYHYLMSFPYRAFAHFVSNVPAQIIFLRFIDIGFFAAGLVLFRKVFKLAGVSRLASNVVMLFFVLVPVVPFMAAQLNYDNLLFLLSGLSLLLTLRVADEIRRTKQLAIPSLLILASVMLLASIVKYAFLPLFIGILLYLLLVVHREIGLKPGAFFASFMPSLRTLKSARGMLLVLFFVLSLGLFAERYAVNMVRYHTPTPECDVVLNVEACRAYDPFGRNQMYKEQRLHEVLTIENKLTYPNTWISNMMRSLYISVGGREENYPYGRPMPVPFITAIIVAVAGTVLLAWRARSLWRRHPALPLFFIVIAVYLGLLFFQNLADYLSLGVPVAVQGRYAVPVLLLGFALVALAARDVLRNASAKVSVAVIGVLLVLTLQGGGFLTFLIRSADSWIWDNPVPQEVNRVTRAVLWHEIVN